MTTYFYSCVTQVKGRQGAGQGSLLCSQKVQNGASQTGMAFLISRVSCIFLKNLRFLKMETYHLPLLRFVATTCCLKWIPRMPSPFETLPALWEMPEFWPRWIPSSKTICWKCLNKKTSLNFPASRYTPKFAYVGLLQIIKEYYETVTRQHRFIL